MKVSKTGFLVMALCAVFWTSTVGANPPPMFSKCQMCHGKQLIGKKKSPPIIGLSYEDLLASLTSNIPKRMKRISKKLTEKQKVELSQYISKLGEQ